MPDLNTLKREISESNNGKSEVHELEEDREFSVEELRQKWDAFADQIRQEGRESEYATLKQEWKLEEKYRVRMQLTNGVQQLSMEKLNQDLTLFLRKSLCNKNISVEWEVAKNEHKKLIYTNSEKFEHLAEKNPALRKLKDRLDLDTDF